ncbi:MAG: D-alanine--D-alanine ligase [Thermodesulfovibrionales bacterium]
MLTDKRIGVLMGGTSAERDVSLKSGHAVFNALKCLNYNVIAIDVGPDICNVLRRERLEIAFIALHGGYGENGAIQGLLEVMDIPYTGSGVLASALAMDKEASKKVFLYHGIPVPPFVVVASNELRVTSSNSAEVQKRRSEGGKTSELPDSSLVTRHLLQDFELPWVIKPAAEGSSIGVSIVRDKLSLDSAIDRAQIFGERVIIERYIEGKEVHVGILNDAVLGAVEVRPKSEFYSYEAKYTPGLTEYILPPEVPTDVLRKAEGVALSAHKALGCNGATRVDLIVDKDGNPYLLEVNTVPGMTETSLLPKIAGLSGYDFPSLVEEILKEAIMKGKERDKKKNLSEQGYAS